MSTAAVNDKKQLIREMAENDLVFFAKLVGPHRLYGSYHEEVMTFLMRTEKKNQLVLIPRAHLKSHIIAVWCAWYITNHPDTSIIYVSATERLAKQQLFAIKNILSSKQYRRYWPEMINEEESKRAKWSQMEIIVDHPLRAEMQVRDPTVQLGSVGSNTTGLHADVLIYDDMVVAENAYTEIGRQAVLDAYSQFSSVLNPDGITKAVGTRYHPSDLYAAMIEEEVPIFDGDSDNIVGYEPAWEIMQGVVEEDGIFLWPREQHPETKKWYGFNNKVLAGIKSKYKNPAHFNAQYYNEPNDPDSHRVGRDNFQYYEPSFLKYNNGVWYMKDKRLNIYAGMDVAWTDGKKSDYTAIVVIGLDSDGFIYVLEAIRFKTTSFLKYYEEVAGLHRKWGFRKLRIETNSGGKIVERELKSYIRKNGDALIIEGKHATQHEGKKSERHAAIVEHRYLSGDIYHCRGGAISALEEEIMLERPPNDDLEDALCGAIEISIPPPKSASGVKKVKLRTHSRFGGIIR